jgi:hypothetical protein
MLRGSLICALFLGMFALQSEAKKRLGPARQVEGCPDTCLQDVYDVIKFSRDRVGNFIRQKKRLESHIKIQGKKLLKKDEYSEYAAELRTGLGGKSGNTTSFICGVRNEGPSLGNATETYKFLSSCNTTISTLCTKDTTIISKETEDALTVCADKMTVFQTKVDECQKISKDVNDATVSAVCTCWNEANVLVKEIKALNCDASKASTAVKNMKKKCVDSIIDCKKSMLKIPGLLADCQVDPLNADKSVEEITSSKEHVDIDGADIREVLKLTSG